LGTCTEQINLASPGATVQHAEILAVLAAMCALPGPVNIVSDSQYVVKAINSIETARLKGDPNSTIFQLLKQAQLVIQAHTSPFFITHIHSHTGLPGPMAKGNQIVDQLSPSLLLRTLKILLPFFNRPYKFTLYLTRVLTHYTSNSQP
jgi:ribonuclease HI